MLKPTSFIKQIINQIFLVIKRIWNRLLSKKEIVYKPEPVDLKYVHVKDLTEIKLKKMQTLSGTFIVRNRITGSVVVTCGSADTIKLQYNENDYEIVDASIKE